MFKNCLFVFLFALCGASLQGQSAWREKLAPEVLAALQQGTNPDVVVMFAEQADVRAAAYLPTKDARAHFTFQQLRATAARTQVGALRILAQKQAFASSFYIVNAIAVEKADADVLRQLAELKEVSRIAVDPWTFFEGPAAQESAPVADRGAVEWGVAKINAPSVWALGYTGQGITVGGADTGYDWQHPAIQPHYRGWNNVSNTANHTYNWHDAIHEPSPLNGDSLNPCGFNSMVPCDDNSHGTHTMGTMTGDDFQGNQIGVAPGAQWVACRNMERGWGKPSSYIECFEWFLAPTDLNNLNPDPTKAPHVINNSWYCADNEGCNDVAIENLMRTAVINLRASGVVVVVSNGNFGSSCASGNEPPAYFEESFSIGATRSDDTIAGFSSRGPVTIDGSNRSKPNVSAPGVSVRSSTPGNNYSSFSGTSMAGPHVAGLVALILSARPELAGEVEIIEMIIEETAVFLADGDQCGIPGSSLPNYAYGFGRVDALAAVQKALLYVVSSQEPSTGVDVALSPNPISEEALFTLKNALGALQLDVYDMQGRRLFNRNWTNADGLSIVRVPTSGFDAGVYVWTLRSEQGVLSGKMVKN